MKAEFGYELEKTNKSQEASPNVLRNNTQYQKWNENCENIGDIEFQTNAYANNSKGNNYVRKPETLSDRKDHMLEKWRMDDDQHHEPEEKPKAKAVPKKPRAEVVPKTPEDLPTPPTEVDKISIPESKDPLDDQNEEVDDFINDLLDDDLGAED